MLTFETTGSPDKSEGFLERLLKTSDVARAMERYGQAGVAALASATPVESGETAALWSYKVNRSAGGYEIVWSNSHVVNGVPIAIILQYGHGTGTGGYVAGRDYINPAIRPIFDKIADEVWKAVTA